MRTAGRRRRDHFAPMATGRPEGSRGLPRSRTQRITQRGWTSSQLIITRLAEMIPSVPDVRTPRRRSRAGESIKPMSGEQASPGQRRRPGAGAVAAAASSSNRRSGAWPTVFWYSEKAHSPIGTVTCCSAFSHASALAVLVSLMAGADWPRFRGADGAAAAPQASPPLRWGAGENSPPGRPSSLGAVRPVRSRRETESS